MQLKTKLQDNFRTVTGDLEAQVAQRDAVIASLRSGGGGDGGANPSGDGTANVSVATGAAASGDVSLELSMLQDEKSGDLSWGVVWFRGVYR